MTMHENSLAAYAELNLTERQKEVLQAFLSCGGVKMTDRQAAKQLRWEINRVDPRIGELVKMGALEECNRIRGPMGRMVRVSRIKQKETLFEV
jgi:hypothetical protein